jgi:ComF family protein
MAASPEHVARERPRRKPRRAPKRIGAIERLVFPQRSLITNRELPGPGALEADLWKELVFLRDPRCEACGVSFDLEVIEGQLCGACIASRPVYARARAALEYGDISRQLVLALKRAGRRDGLDLFAGWMEQAAPDLIRDADLIVPVPLHYIRHLMRGFNQSVWLAAALSRRTGVPMSVDALRRRKPTPSQAGLSPAARRNNVEHAFRARASRKALLRGRRILLIDDVFTTGATSEACARALLRAGAGCVDVLTLARVAGPRRVPI